MSDPTRVSNIVAAVILERNPERRPEQKLLLLNSPVRAAVVKGESRLLEKVNVAIAKAKEDGTLPASVAALAEAAAAQGILAAIFCVCASSYVGSIPALVRDDRTPTSVSL